MTNDQQAFTNALVAWLSSQEANPPDAIVAMVSTAGAALGTSAPSLLTLGEGISLTQQLLIASAINAFERKERDK
jgi:glycerate-2-kinase